MFVKVVSLLAAMSAVFASETVVNRRVLETEKGYKDIVRHLKDYEVHDFSAHSSTRRALASAGEKFINYELEVLGRRMTLALERFDDLFAADYKHNYLNDKGEVIKTEDALDCVYKGSVMGDESALAAVTLCGGMVHATVHHTKDNDQSFTIQPLDIMQESTKEHIVYRHRDLQDTKLYCGVGMDDTPPIADAPDGRRLREDGHEHIHHVSRPSAFEDRSKSAIEAKRANVRKLDSTLKYVGVSVVNSHKRYLQKGFNTHAHSASLFLGANTLYAKVGVAISSTFTFQLQIVSMYTFTAGDPWVATPSGSPTAPPVGNVRVDANGGYNSGDLLASFNSWRAGANGVKPVQSAIALDGHDLAHLLSGDDFSYPVIGLAFVGAVCTDQRSGQTQAVDITDAQISSTITHEIGHNLGAQHTNTPPSGFSSCENPDGQQIMSAASGIAYTNWESCTMEYFRREFVGYPVAGQTKCAEASSAPIWDGAPVCGDGFRQGSEQCDCIDNNCVGVDACCNGATCQLLPTAECSALDACCTGSCKVINTTTTLCRAAVTSCDIAEYCDGVNGQCPFDRFNDTGTPCTTTHNYNGRCYNKQCYDMGEECFVRGQQNSQPGSQWDQPCDATAETTTASPPGTDCLVKCKQGTFGTCQFYTEPVQFADGTQCDTGKACYQGNCIAFAALPVLLNPKCTNGFVDQNETDVDCGGPNCFGCIPGKLCSANSDCLSGNCNKTATVDRNGYTGLGLCAAGPAAGSAEDLLNSILAWFRQNPQIWGPIVGVLALLILACCFCPRGQNKPPIAKATFVQAQQSFRQMRGQGSQTDLPVAVAVRN